TIPAPGVDKEPKRTIGLDVGVSGYVLLLTVAGILTAHHVVGFQRTHRLEHGGLLRLHGSKIPAGRRFHGKQSHNLKKMILDDVAQAPGGLVKRAARSHAEAFRQGDLDTRDVIAVPDWFKKRIGEAEVEDIHDRFFAEEVIDAKD